MPYIIAIVIFALAGVSYSFFFTDSSEPSATPEAPVAAIVQPEVELVEDDLLTDNEIEPDPDPELVKNSDVIVREVSGEQSYLVPRRITHSLEISLTLEGNIITAATMNHDENGVGVTKSHINFDKAYEPFVIGANINDISLSRVGGASMTSKAFNDIIEDIRVELANDV